MLNKRTILFLLISMVLLVSSNIFVSAEEEDYLIIVEPQTIESLQKEANDPVYYSLKEEEPVVVPTVSLKSLMPEEAVRAYSSLSLDNGVYVINNHYLDTVDAGVCSTSSTKTYMDYRAITATGSAQYKFIRAHMTVNEDTGLLVDEYGFVGVALGSYYGKIGDRFLFVLDSGVILPVVKIDSKSDSHTVNGCSHSNDSSVIEMVIHKGYAQAYFGKRSNGLIASGNFNNSPEFKGRISKAYKVVGIETKNITKEVMDLEENIEVEVFNKRPRLN